jgi:integrase
VRLNQKDVDQAFWGGKDPDIRRDDTVRGLALRVYKSGRKSYIIEWSLAGQRGRDVIGDATITPLSRIRDIAREKLTIIKSGSLPIRPDMTISSLCDEFITRHAKAKTKSWRQTERLIDTWIKPKIGTWRIDRLTRGVVAKLHSEIGQNAPTNANRMLDHLRKIFNTAVEWGYLEKKHDNPATGITRFPEVKRGRYITQDEMPTFIEHVNKVPDIYSRSAIWLLLLTACRENEILSLKWSQVDLQNGRIFLVRTKQGREHAIPLVPMAIEIIKEIPKHKTSEFLFPSKKAKSGHMEGFRVSWDEVRKNAKIKDVTVHDLRRTMGSWMASAGTTINIIGGILGHSNPATTQIYARLFDGAKRDALESATKQMLEAKSTDGQ